MGLIICFLYQSMHNQNYQKTYIGIINNFVFLNILEEIYVCNLVCTLKILYSYSYWIGNANLGSNLCF